MYPCINRVKTTVLLFSLHILWSHSITVNVHPRSRQIFAKKKIQLVPVNIACFLNDIVRLSAPMIHENDVYYLSKPNGDSYPLDLHAPKELNINRTKYHIDRSLDITFLDRTTSVVNHADTYSVFRAQDFDKNSRDLEPNEFMVGPLMEEDYGNWVLTVYTTALDGEWIELFQVFTMAITEYIKLMPLEPRLQAGDTFNLSFVYPIPGMESCEVIAPRSTYDRFFDRTLNEFDKCAFSIPNVTKADEGNWRIIGFGKIVYQGEVYLRVKDETYLNSILLTTENSTSVENTNN